MSCILSRPVAIVAVVGALAACDLVASNSKAELVQAVRDRNHIQVRLLLKGHVDVNVPEIDGTTALHWAVHWDEVGLVKSLISDGANVRSSNRYGVTPLSLACRNGDGEVIELLLKAGADPNTTLPGGETALMTAARSGTIVGVNVLLTHGANVNAKEEGREQTALMWASAEGNTAVVETLLAHGADIHARSKSGFTAFLFAAREGKIEVVRALLKSGVDVNEELPTSSRFAHADALVLAVANAHYDLAAILLDAGAKEDAPALGWTVLHEITWVRKPGSGSNPLPPEETGKMDSLEFVKDLVRHGEDVNARVTKKPYDLGTTNLNVIGATPFLMAARTADAPLMRLLAKLGANPLLPNVDHTTPLLVAAGVGTLQFGEDPGTEAEVLEAVKVALELGGNVNDVDDNGDTVIHGAAYKECPSVVQFLITKGARSDIWNRKNKLGWTPLRISEGVTRGQNVRYRSPATAAVIRQALIAAGLPTTVEPEKLVSR